MNILYLTHRLPYPPNKGDKIRSYRLLRHLESDHTVYLGCLIDNDRDLRYLDNVREWARGGVVHQQIRPSLRRPLASRNLLLHRPISNAYFYSYRLQREIDHVLDNAGIDLVLCFCSAMAEYLLRSRSKRMAKSRPALIMDMVDVDSQKWREYASTSPVWKRWVYALEASTLSRYEHIVTEIFDHVLLVSEQERRILVEQTKAENLTAVTNGVDLDYFRPTEAAARLCKQPAIVFTGAMDYKPNVDGVTWFAERVLPRVHRAVPDARFYIVGSRPKAAVRRLAAEPGVVVTGFVDDVRPYLAGADVCVAPLLVARGIQNKVLEAMAMARPTVATPEALTGIHASDGEVKSAGTEAEFAAAVTELLQNRTAAKAQGICARHAVERDHSWEVALAGLDQLIETVSSPARVAA